LEVRVPWHIYTLDVFYLSFHPYLLEWRKRSAAAYLGQLCTEPPSRAHPPAARPA
jgi:hypothetical protein